jgi:hypothetical protein
MLFNFIDKNFPILAANISPLPIAAMLALHQSKVSLRGSPGKTVYNRYKFNTSTTGNLIESFPHYLFTNTNPPLSVQNLAFDREEEAIAVAAAATSSVFISIIVKILTSINI